MKKRHPVIEGTIILTLAGFLSRMIGFYNRIFLSRTIGAKELGIYQIIFPVYLFCFAVCCQGFQVGLSQLIAANKAANKEGNVQYLLKTSIFICCTLSFFLSVGLFYFSDEISTCILNMPASSLCLKITALALPFVTIKGCIQGYYIGCGISAIPAACQLIEQIARVGSILFIAHTFFYIKCSGAKLAVTGMVIGEAISCLFMVLFYHKETNVKKRPEDRRRTLFKNFFQISLPLSGNRICLTLLQSIEAIFIPKQLVLFYCDQTIALELYGILTGITLPFLMFPSTVTNSLATMLLPSVSADCEKRNYTHLNRTVTLTTYGSFFMGLLFTGIFFLLGPWLGTTIFHNMAAGEYLKILSFLCPALYLSSIFTSILNGMGKTRSTFSHNIISIIIRLLFIYFAIPFFGIDGYIWGILVSTFALVLLNYLEIQKKM
ncbi:MAG: polysaccharide biosynthesis protein [Lachnospiraceae bacterium]|nr:polysaccharide biosynthesis protein [Lachnospiraceae bacterium]